MVKIGVTINTYEAILPGASFLTSLARRYKIHPMCLDVPRRKAIPPSRWKCCIVEYNLDKKEEMIYNASRMAVELTCGQCTNARSWELTPHHRINVASCPIRFIREEEIDEGTPGGYSPRRVYGNGPTGIVLDFTSACLDFSAGEVNCVNTLPPLKEESEFSFYQELQSSSPFRGRLVLY